MRPCVGARRYARNFEHVTPNSRRMRTSEQNVWPQSSPSCCRYLRLYCSLSQLRPEKSRKERKNQISCVLAALISSLSTPRACRRDTISEVTRGQSKPWHSTNSGWQQAAQMSLSGMWCLILQNTRQSKVYIVLISFLFHGIFLVWTVQIVRSL